MVGRSKNINTVYLAGPMRGFKEFNFPAFIEGAKKLRCLGYEVSSPAEVDLEMGFDPKKTLEEQNFILADTFRRDVEMILLCDSLALLPGHEKSKLATLERELAEAIGLDVFELYP